MKIASSHVVMEASRQFLEKNEEREETRVWMNGSKPVPSPGARAPSGPRAGGDRVLLTHKGGALPESNVSASMAKEVEEAQDEALSSEPGINLARMILEALTGKKIRLLHTARPVDESSSVTRENVNAGGHEPPRASGEGWGMVADRFESHYEKETMAFAADGFVQTNDGRKIAFSLDVLMTREFYSEVSTSLRAGEGAMVDPLVIHFGAVPDGLTQARFRFDLDADGKEEEIPFVLPGSALLALDLNGDGRINDGTELFGPTTGNGFRELALHDEDGNGWIDENDSVFDRLSLWFKDSEGNDQWKGLRARGVGAIFVGNVQSPFALKDQVNQLHGQVVRSGVVLMESGEVRSIQQVDMVV